MSRLGPALTSAQRRVLAVLAEPGGTAAAGQGGIVTCWSDRTPEFRVRALTLEPLIIDHLLEIEYGTGRYGNYKRTSQARGLGGTMADWYAADKGVDERLFAWNVEVVPINDVLWYREYDRRGGHHASGKETIARLKEILAREGFRKALHLTYCLNTQTLHLGEGNHRAQAAAELGFRGVPVKVGRNETCGRNTDSDFSRRAVPSQFIGKDGYYVPADLRPSDVGVPSRPLTPEERQHGVKP